MSGAAFGNGFSSKVLDRHEEERLAQAFYWGLPDSATWAEIHQMYEEQHQQVEAARKALEERDRASALASGACRWK